MAIELLAALNELEPKALLAHDIESIDLVAEEELVISGGTFSPTLSKKPVGFLVLDSDGNQIDINHPTSALNGAVYDVTLYSSESLFNLKIVALCTRV